MSLIPAKYYYGEDNDVSKKLNLFFHAQSNRLLGSMAAQEANERTKASSQESKARSSLEQDGT